MHHLIYLKSIRYVYIIYIPTFLYKLGRMSIYASVSVESDLGCAIAHFGIDTVDLAHT
jgi:hypothetical protein